MRIKSESTVLVSLSSDAIVLVFSANLLRTFVLTFPKPLISGSESSDLYLPKLDSSSSSSSSFGVEWYDGQLSYVDGTCRFSAIVLINIFSSNRLLNSVRLCTLTDSETIL